MKINLKTTIGAFTMMAGSSFVASTTASADSITADSQAQAGDIQVRQQEAPEAIAISATSQTTSYNQAIIDAVNAERANYGLPAIQQSSADLQGYADQRNSLDGNTIIGQHTNNDAYMQNVYYGAQDYTAAQGNGAETLMLAVDGSSAEEVAANFISSVYATDASGAWNNAHVNMMLNANIADAAFAVRPDDTYGMGYQIVGLYILNDDTSNAASSTTFENPAAPAQTIVMPEAEETPSVLSRSTDGIEFFGDQSSSDDQSATAYYETFAADESDQSISRVAPQATAYANNAEATPYSSNIDPNASIDTGDGGSTTDLTVSEKSGSGSENNSENNANNNNSNNGAGAENNNQAPTLPNTGEASQKTLSIIGLGLTSVTAGMIAARRSRN